MSDTDLLFSLPTPASPDLVFGQTEDAGDNASARINAAFPPLWVQAFAARVESARVAATFPPLQVQALAVPSVQAVVGAAFRPLQVLAQAAYNSNTARPTVGQAASEWQDAERAAPAGASVPQQDATAAPDGWAEFWRVATSAPAGFAHPLPGTLERTPRSHAERHQAARGLQDGIEQQHQDAERTRTQATAPHQDATPVTDQRTARHQVADMRKRAGAVAPWQEAQGRRAGAGTDFQPATPLFRRWLSRYQEGRTPPAGVTLPPVEPPKPPGCYDPDPALLFSWPWGYGGTALVFQCGDYGQLPTEPIVVPVRKVYIVINSISLLRVEGAVPIPADAFSMSLDVDSWTWQWSASLPGSALSLVMRDSSGDPVEVEATVNGQPFRLAVEGIGRERSFGRDRVNVKGRGRAAILDAPYAPVLNHANADMRTAQQLMSEVLTLNGASVGWSIDWGLADWVVPGNVWTHQGTYISALTDIADAVGGYLQPHDTGQILRVLHRYPSAPWGWAGLTPDYVLPADVVSVEGIEWQNKARYERVYVSGQRNGVLGQVTRSGTAGGMLAPMVTHPLITHVDAARQRGLAVLGNTGRQAHVSLRLPVLPETGVIKPGAMVRYVADGAQRQGLVRSTSLEWAAPTLRQALTVETHLA